MSGLADLSPDDARLVLSIMDSHGYDELKWTQQQALSDGILGTDNHLLVAETGNGKTLCAEAVVKKRLQSGCRAAYLVPSRQLVGAKRETLQEWADGEYTISAGPGAYRSADVVVATFDSFYRAILRNRGDARSLDLVVLDDFHEIYGEYRGPEIEKSIAAAMYEGIELLGLSATLGNPETLAEWMDATLTVSQEERQVPIRETAVARSGGSKKRDLVQLLRQQRDRGPFLVFNFAKSWLESRAEAVARAGVFADTSERDLKRELRQRVQGVVTDRLDTLGEMLSKGVGYHHADLPQNLKQWIEQLYRDGEIACLFTTTTIAYGFDAPVQSVVVADTKRFGDYVGVYEYVQWIGRAARPGYGYSRGDAFTLCAEPDEVRDRFFGPDRELEDVTTHVESDGQFRWLVLELIASGWDQSHEIEAFVKEVLYWSQLEPVGAWNRERDSRDERLTRRLRETADWLIANEFVDEADTARAFSTQPLGDGAVEFAFNSFVSAQLSEIKTFYDWIAETPHDEIDPLALILQVADHFEETISTSESDITGQFAGTLQEEGLPLTEAGITAGLITGFWMQNISRDNIETQTGVDSSYLSSHAGRLSDTLEATRYLFEASVDARLPEWFDSVVLRVDRGVRGDEVPFVENVRGLGRHRVRALREFVTRSDMVAVESDDDSTLWELLRQFRSKVDDTAQFERVLRDQVHGIGPKTADRVSQFVESADSPDHSRAVSAGTVPDARVGEGSGGSSTLDDF
ncbi:MAG: DEAD/DEAH box helicase, partial [Halobaculum sp.]